MRSPAPPLVALVGR
ncbi:hypothetical protein [Burkholderia pyrrocinia]|nr:hypothetical protein [Burkholderia pyrrocinia]